MREKVCGGRSVSNACPGSGARGSITSQAAHRWRPLRCSEHDWVTGRRVGSLPFINRVEWPFSACSAAVSVQAMASSCVSGAVTRRCLPAHRALEATQGGSETATHGWHGTWWPVRLGLTGVGGCPRLMLQYCTARATRTLNSLHFEDLKPHRFEDLVWQLAYDSPNVPQN